MSPEQARKLLPKLRAMLRDNCDEQLEVIEVLTDIAQDDA